MDQNEALMNEYNNLWQEKLTHKQSLRKMKGYISYLTTIVSLSLTLMGLSTTDIFKAAINTNSSSNQSHYQSAQNYSDKKINTSIKNDLQTKKDTQTSSGNEFEQKINGNNNSDSADNITNNLINIFILISMPFTIIVLLVASFALNDLFQIYVIGNQIGNIEMKMNSVYGKSMLFAWEHRICPIVFGGKDILPNNDKIMPFTNIIRQNDLLIFFPFVGIMCLTSLLFGGHFLFKYNGWLFLGYVLINSYFLGSFIMILKKLGEYTKADGALSKIIFSLNTMDEFPKNHLSEPQ